MSNEPWNQQPAQSGQSAPHGWENSDWVPASADQPVQASYGAMPTSDATTMFPSAPPPQAGYPQDQAPMNQAPMNQAPQQQPPMGQQGFGGQGGFAQQPQFGGQPAAPWMSPALPQTPGLGTVFDFSFRQVATPFVAKFAMFSLIALGLMEWALVALFGFQWSVVYSVWKTVADGGTTNASGRVKVNYAFGIVAVVLGWIPGAVQVLLGRAFLEVANRYLTTPPQNS